MRETKKNRLSNLRRTHSTELRDAPSLPGLPGISSPPCHSPLQPITTGLTSYYYKPDTHHDDMSTHLARLDWTGRCVQQGLLPCNQYVRTFQLPERQSLQTDCQSPAILKALLLSLDFRYFENGNRLQYSLLLTLTGRRRPEQMMIIESAQSPFRPRKEDEAAAATCLPCLVCERGPRAR